MATQGCDIETIAATFMVMRAVVKQRLRLASVSSKLHDIYAEDGMTLEQLMADEAYPERLDFRSLRECSDISDRQEWDQ